jgi:hypothetical protein
MAKLKYSSRKQIIESSPVFDELVQCNKLDVSDKIVLLTKENAEKIENLIKSDDDYFPFSQQLFNYYGLTRIKTNQDKALFAVAREIDRDNSTNVWRYNKNRNSFYNMINYISNPTNDFFNDLEKGTISLPDKIVEKCGSGLKSLSSKICKYLCEFSYQKDNYYINDSYIRAMLLFYLDFYEVKHDEVKSINDVNLMSYETLYKWLEKLHEARNKKHQCKITKSELDHILWYCYKSFDL